MVTLKSNRTHADTIRHERGNSTHQLPGELRSLSLDHQNEAERRVRLPLSPEDGSMGRYYLMESLKRNSAQPLLLTIPDVAASLGLCRSKVYELIAKEGLPVVRFGRSVRISAASLQKWVEKRERQHLPNRDA